MRHWCAEAGEGGAAVAGADPFVERIAGLGPGLHVAVKDMLAVAGLPQTGGLAVRARRRAPADAAAVAALRRLGFIIAGVTRTDAAGFGTMTPEVRNPRHGERAVGGSSGGSAAAVAAGLADVGLGTDTGGSGRIPAAYCDLVAFKAGRGRSDMTGVLPLAPSFDTLAVMARGFATLLRAAPALLTRAGSLERTPARWRHDTDVAATADPQVRSAFARVVDRLPVARPWRSGISFEALARWHSMVVCAEALQVHQADWRRAPGLFPPVVARALAEAERLSTAAVARARRAVEAAGAALASSLAVDEILVVPTLPMAPQPRGTTVAIVGGRRCPITAANIRYTMAFNVAGLPVVVAPIDGLSVQFVGAKDRDEWLLREVSAFAASPETSARV